MPSGTVDLPSVEDNHDGTVCVKYEPREVGSHELAVKYNGEHVQGDDDDESLMIMILNIHAPTVNNHIMPIFVFSLASPNS